MVIVKIIIGNRVQPPNYPSNREADETSKPLSTELGWEGRVENDAKSGDLP